MNTNDAQEQLRLISEAQQAEQQLGRSEEGWLWFIWGAVWLVGFLLTQFAPTSWRLWSWLGLCSLGAIGSGIVGARLGRQVQYRQTGPKLGWFYVVSVGFGLRWLGLAQPTSWQQTAVLGVTFLGFTILVSGILLRAGLLVGIGGGMVGLITAVYLLIPGQLGVLLGLVGGGSMIAYGLWLLLGGGHRGTA